MELEHENWSECLKAPVRRAKQVSVSQNFAIYAINVNVARHFELVELNELVSELEGSFAEQSLVQKSRKQPELVASFRVEQSESGLWSVATGVIGVAQSGVGFHFSVVLVDPL